MEWWHLKASTLSQQKLNRTIPMTHTKPPASDQVHICQCSISVPVTKKVGHSSPKNGGLTPLENMTVGVSSNDFIVLVEHHASYELWLGLFLGRRQQNTTGETGDKLCVCFFRINPHQQTRARTAK